MQPAHIPSSPFQSKSRRKYSPTSSPHPQSTSWTQRVATSAPRLFMHVCRRWRDIAVATPRLWTRFRVDLDEPIRKDEFFASLKRSGDLPLDVEVYAEGECEELGHLRALAKYCDRIEKLSIEMPPYLLAELQRYWAAKQPRAEFPVLKELFLKEMHDLDDGIEMLEETPVRMFVNSTQLQRVDLCGIPLFGLVFPRANITHFDGFIWPMGDFVKILESMPLLVECAVVIDLEMDDYLEMAPVQHANLQSLTIRVKNLYADAGDWDILGACTFPSLQKLALQDGVPVPANMFSTLKTRSPLVSTLSVHGYGLGSSSVRYFSPLTSIHTLDLVAVVNHVVTTFFDTFSRDRTFLPALRTLQFTRLSYAALYLFIETASGAIKERRALDSGCCLKTVVGAITVMKADVERLVEGKLAALKADYDELKGQGVEISVRYPVSTKLMQAFNVQPRY